MYLFVAMLVSIDFFFFFYANVCYEARSTCNKGLQPKFSPLIIKYSILMSTCTLCHINKVIIIIIIIIIIIVVVVVVVVVVIIIIIIIIIIIYVGMELEKLKRGKKLNLLCLFPSFSLKVLRNCMHRNCGQNTRVMCPCILLFTQVRRRYLV